jgi:protein SCO1/2
MKKALAVLLLIALALPLAASEGSSRYFGDVELVDQDGKPANLHRLMDGRTVVMNTFFASCTGSCPIMARTFLAVQEKYGERLDKDLVMISITVDPENDTPAKLKAYAKAMKAEKGWYFLTGSREQVDLALKRIGQYTEQRDGHKNLIVAGNDRTGLWKKAFGLAKSDEIVAIVTSVIDDPGV